MTTAAHVPAAVFADCGVGQVVKVGATQAPVPVTAKSYTASSQSLLLIVIVAFCTPIAVGLKVTMNVAELLAATEVGAPLTTNLALLEVMLEMVSSAFPVLKMVNVRTSEPLTTTSAKPVWSVVEGVLSPSLMVVSGEPPCTLASGAITAGQFVPVTTPPGVTQLEAVPVSPKLFRVPLLSPPAASVRVVTPLLFSLAKPWLKL